MPQTSRRASERKTSAALHVVASDNASTSNADVTRAERDESEAAALAYRVYERLGAERTIAATAEALRDERPGHYKATSATLERRLKVWANKYHWRARARAYDYAQELKERIDAERARRHMNETQAEIATRLMSRVGRRVLDLLDIDQSAINATKQVQNLYTLNQPVPPHLAKLMSAKPALTLGGAVLTQLLRDLVDIERLARGAATEIAQASEHVESESATASSVVDDASSALARATLFYFPTPDEPPAEHDE